jgi:hypothetical protein
MQRKNCFIKARHLEYVGRYVLKDSYYVDGDNIIDFVLQELLLKQRVDLFHRKHKG